MVFLGSLSTQILLFETKTVHVANISMYVFDEDQEPIINNQSHLTVRTSNQLYRSIVSQDFIEEQKRPTPYMSVMNINKIINNYT